MSSRQPEQSTEFGLPTDLGIAGADALKVLLLEWVDRPGTVRMQAPKVDRLHAASLQLLAAFARDRRQAGQTWCWGDVAPPLRQAAERMGLSEVLGLVETPAEPKEKH